MANVTAKTSSNIFYKARCEAATHNEQLSSRAGKSGQAYSQNTFCFPKNWKNKRNASRYHSRWSD